jgi:predicted acyltransferase
MSTTQFSAQIAAPISASAPTGRLLSLDVYRGLTVAGMILVTNPANYSHVYPQLLHAEWNGVTLTDMIAPSFLFLIGVSLTFSFPGRMRRGATRRSLAGHVLFRVVALIVLGLVLNAFPDFNLTYLRIPGILQHIAVCLLIGGLLFCVSGKVVDGPSGAAVDFRPRVSVIVAAIVVLTAADWILMRYVPVPGYGAGHLDPFGNMGGLIDRTLFGTNHLWPWGNYWWDPDGMLSTLTASGNLMLGILAGSLLRSPLAKPRKVLFLAGAGCLLFSAALLMDRVYPINKKIWTPSYMLFSGGFCLVALAAQHGIFDRAGKQELLRRLSTPALIFGANAILAFAFTTILNSLAPKIHLTGADGIARPLPGAAYELFAQMLAPRNASLAYALLFVLLNLLLLAPFHRKGIFLKI